MRQKRGDKKSIVARRKLETEECESSSLETGETLIKGRPLLTGHQLSSHIYGKINLHPADTESIVLLHNIISLGKLL